MADALRPAAFLDRDGVIIKDFGYVYRADDLVFIKGAIEAVAKLNRLNFSVVVITNQSGVARGLFDEEQLKIFHDYLQDRLNENGAYIDAIYYCPYHPQALVDAYRLDHEDRKPGSGMLHKAIKDLGIDPDRSFMIGDKASDLEAARGAGVRGYLFNPSGSLLECVEMILSGAII